MKWQQKESTEDSGILVALTRRRLCLESQVARTVELEQRALAKPPKFWNGWIDFDTCDLLWIWNDPDAEANPRLAGWIGVANRVGSDLCHWVTNVEGSILARTTVQHVVDLDRTANCESDNVNFHA
jgi:hypothetical protein